MRTLLLLLTLLASQASTAGPLADRLSLELRADHAAAFEGYTKVREWKLEGEHLDLRDDLGVDQWFGFSFEAAWRFDAMHAIRSGFTWHQFRGGKTFDHDVPHDGAVFGAGTTIDVALTRWWRAEVWYEFTPVRADWGAFTLLGGVTMDDLNVFLHPNRKLLSTKQEHHEDFGAQRMPLPSFGLRLELTPLPKLRVAIEARGTYVDNLATWYFEGGRIRTSQTKLELWAEIGYRVAELEFGAALRYRTFQIDDQSTEDGNEFSIYGTFAEAFVSVWL